MECDLGCIEIQEYIHIYKRITYDGNLNFPRYSFNIFEIV